MYICMHACLSAYYTHIHTHTFTYMHAHIHKHTHTHTHLCRIFSAMHSEHTQCRVDSARAILALTPRIVRAHSETAQIHRERVSIDFGLTELTAKVCLVEKMCFRR